jgi:hypothetical protein
MAGVTQECGASHPSLLIIMDLIINRANLPAKWLGPVQFLAAVSTIRRLALTLNGGVREVGIVQNYEKTGLQEVVRSVVKIIFFV